MNRQLPVWRTKGEGPEAFARLTSRIFFRRYPGGALRRLGAVALFCARPVTVFGFFPDLQVEGQFHVRERLPSASLLKKGGFGPFNRYRHWHVDRRPICGGVAVYLGATACSNPNRTSSWQSAGLQQARWRPTDQTQVRLRRRGLGGQIPTHDSAP